YLVCVDGTRIDSFFIYSVLILFLLLIDKVIAVLRLFLSSQRLRYFVNYLLNIMAICFITNDTSFHLNGIGSKFMDGHYTYFLFVNIEHEAIDIRWYFKV